MNIHDILEFITEGICPTFLYVMFTVICLFGGINAIQRKRSFRKEGKIVEAEILQYMTEIRQGRYGNYRERIHIITLQCIPPDDTSTHIYTLITNASKARRYKHTDKAEVCFIPGESLPVLKEDMTHIGADSILGIFGAVLCGLISLLFIIALISSFFLK